jgi:hypothetical protein
LARFRLLLHDPQSALGGARFAFGPDDVIETDIAAAQIVAAREFGRRFEFSGVVDLQTPD